MEQLRSGAGLVCDLDGVLYRGDEPISGAADAVQRLRGSGVTLLFCTNNSYSSLNAYERKLAAMGIPIERDELLTSAVVTAEVLAKRGLSGSRALVIGGEGVREALEERGIEPCDAGNKGGIDVVVVGYDPRFDYVAMREATRALLNGALFVATNDDASFPAPGGALWPGAGAILASLRVASGRSPEVMGKPHAPMMDEAEARLGAAGPIWVVGDRAETDLAGGRAKGWTTVLVLSGVTHSADVASLDPPPDIVLDGISDLGGS